MHDNQAAIALFCMTTLLLGLPGEGQAEGRTQTPSQAASEALTGERQSYALKALIIDANEGCDLADVDKDGHIDIIAGRLWYAGPEFVPRPLRLLADWNQYTASNGDHAVDVDGDGWVDVISGSFGGPKVYWYRNPGKVGLERGWLWEQRELFDTGSTTNEGTYLRDIDGDGTPEFIINSWSRKAPMQVFRLTRDSEGKPTMTRHVIGPRNGHGIAFGDINNDGREDILFGGGWYEKPADDPLGKAWKLHEDWTIPSMACPCIVADVDDDGRNDLIWANGHGYGLHLWRQTEPDAAGKLQFEKHEIDTSWSQAHCLRWVDFDGDGRMDLVTGKRIRAHNGKDPGSAEPPVIVMYTWDGTSKGFEKRVLREGRMGGGLQMRVADLNGDGKRDIAAAGKSGTYVLFQE